MDDMISVLMSTYNESNSEISKSIESIINQTYRNYEFIIIIDNPLNEEIKRIVQYYSDKDKRIKVITNSENIGLARSLNRGIDIANGKYIARMDADDISCNDRLEKQLEFIKYNKFDMIASNRIDIDEDGNVLSIKSKLPDNKNINRILPNSNFIIHPTVFIKTDVIKSLGGYRDFATSQDYDLWLRMLSSNYKIGILDEHLIYYRIRRNGISNKDRYKQYLIKKYQQNLYKTRIQNDNKDNFTINNLDKFLIKNKYYNEKDKFNNAYIRFNRCIMDIKNKKFLKGIFNLVYSIISHRKMMIYILDMLRYKIICQFT